MKNFKTFIEDKTLKDIVKRENDVISKINAWIKSEG